MDSMLGASDNESEISDAESVNINKEKCPVHRCRTETFKIRRHLLLHDLKDEQVEYAMQCSKLLNRNARKNSH